SRGIVRNEEPSEQRKAESFLKKRVRTITSQSGCRTNRFSSLLSQPSSAFSLGRIRASPSLSGARGYPHGQSWKGPGLLWNLQTGGSLPLLAGELPRRSFAINITILCASFLSQKALPSLGQQKKLAASVAHCSGISSVLPLAGPCFRSIPGAPTYLVSKPIPISRHCPSR